MSGLPEALETAREAGEVLSAAVLSQENAEGLDGSGLDFRDCRFQSCRLRNCDFTGAAFYGCTFTGCLLENCRLSATYWKDCRLSGCKWDGADLRRSRWKDSVLEETLLRYVNFSGGVWERISVKGCDFTESTLSEMRLKKAAMEKTDLTGAELFRTSLAGMDLTACTLDRIVLSETCRELKGAVINAARPRWWPGFWASGWSRRGASVQPQAWLIPVQWTGSPTPDHTQHTRARRKRRALCCSDCFLLADHVPAPGKQPVREGCRVLPALPCFQGLGSLQNLQVLPGQVLFQV